VASASANAGASIDPVEGDTLQVDEVVEMLHAPPMSALPHPDATERLKLSCAKVPVGDGVEVATGVYVRVGVFVGSTGVLVGVAVG
jgi:hypothetical protein